MTRRPEPLGLQSRREHPAMRFVRLGVVVVACWLVIAAVMGAIALAGIALGYGWSL